MEAAREDESPSFPGFDTALRYLVKQASRQLSEARYRNCASSSCQQCSTQAAAARSNARRRPESDYRIIAELQGVAAEAFLQFPEEERDNIRREFDTMNKDGDNIVTLEELQQWWDARLARTGVQPCWPLRRARDYMHACWEVVDLDGNGRLDFFEVATLLMILDRSSAQVCFGCNRLILDEQLWLHANTARCLLAMSEREYLDHLDLDTAYCDACHAAGRVQHPLGFAWDRVDNEWRRDSFADWSFLARLPDPTDDDDDACSSPAATVESLSAAGRGQGHQRHVLPGRSSALLPIFTTAAVDAQQNDSVGRTIAVPPMSGGQPEAGSSSNGGDGGSSGNSSGLSAMADWMLRRLRVLMGPIERPQPRQENGHVRPMQDAS